jgi:hypothetical protein
MANFDDHDDEFVFADFVDNSVDSLSNPIPILRRKLYAPLSARIIAQSLNPFQDTRNVLSWDSS